MIVIRIHRHESDIIRMCVTCWKLKEKVGPEYFHSYSPDKGHQKQRGGCTVNQALETFYTCKNRYKYTQNHEIFRARCSTGTGVHEEKHCRVISWSCDKY